MATILDHGPVCDGYDAKVELASGDRVTLHFAGGEPEDLHASVDAIEASWPVVEEVVYRIEGEV